MRKLVHASADAMTVNISALVRPKRTMKVFSPPFLSASRSGISTLNMKRVYKSMTGIENSMNSRLIILVMAADPSPGIKKTTGHCGYLSPSPVC